jgi:hypothetical protein
MVTVKANRSVRLVRQLARTPSVVRQPARTPSELDFVTAAAEEPVNYKFNTAQY